MGVVDCSDIGAVEDDPQLFVYCHSVNEDGRLSEWSFGGSQLYADEVC